MKSASETVQEALQARLEKCTISSSTRTDKARKKRIIVMKADFEIRCGDKKAVRRMEWQSDDGFEWTMTSVPGEVLRAMEFLAYGSTSAKWTNKQSYPHVKWMAREVHKQIWSRAKRHARTKKVTGIGRELQRSDERKRMLVALETQMYDLHKRFGTMLRKQDVLEAYQTAVNLRTVKEVMES